MSIIKFKYNVFSFFLALVYCVSIYYIFPHLSEYSDNYYYKLAYNAGYSGFGEYYRFFLWRTAGSEPFSILVFYLASTIFSYEMFVFLTGFLLVFFISNILLRRGNRFWIVTVFIFSCYYLCVLFIGIHRFKLSILFLSAVFYFYGERRSFPINFLAPLFHGQALSIVLLQLFSKLNRVSYLKLVFYFISLVLLFVFLFYFTALPEKIFSRLQFDVSSFVIVFSVSVLFYIFVKRSCLIFSILFLASLFVLFLGGFRMNMIYYGVLFWFLSSSPKKFSFYVLLSVPFMIYKMNYLYFHYLDNLVRG